MTQTRVYVVDDDSALRRSLQRILLQAGYQTRGFASGIAFLQFCRALPAGCVILDWVMPAMDGFEVLKAFTDAGYRWPVIMLTGHAERSTMIRAIRGGSVFFLEKPVREVELLGAVLKAEASLRGTAAAPRDPMIVRSLMLLSPQEQAVLEAMMDGLLNKEIAGLLGMTEGAVKACRRRIRRKIGAKNTTALTKMALLAGFPFKSRA